MSKNREFHKDIVTTVPTSCLIEDYRTLEEAVRKQDWSLVNVAMECIAEVIDNSTTIPKGLNIRPSVSSMIDMDESTGIILYDREDPLCAAIRPISLALSGGVEQCDEKCPYKAKGCDPACMHFIMKDGSIYSNK